MHTNENENSSSHKLIHDIRGSLSPILTYAQLITHNAEKIPPNTDAIKECATEIENIVKSLVSLLDTAE